MENGKDKRSRKPPISYRPPAELEAEFWLRVKRSGLSRNAFITQALFGGEMPRASRRPVIEKQLIVHLLSQTARLHDDLHEISLMAGSDSGVALKLEEAVAELTAIRQACFHAMGRRS